ncbi:unnamed protein product [Rhizophagus irregularis]|nr:unnamed protein product [Rhizophagus irregularis]
MQRASIYNLLFYAVIPHLIPSRFISVSGFESLFCFGFLFLGVSASGSWALDIYISAFGPWALDIWVSAFSSWALDRYRLRYLLGLWIGFHFKLILNRSGFHFGFLVKFPLRFLLNKWFSFGLYLMSRFNFKIIWMSG